MTTSFRDLPSVDKLLADSRLDDLIRTYSREAVIDLMRAELERARNAIKAGQEAPDYDAIVESIVGEASADWKSWPEHVINATGVVLHTNLGRAPLSKEAIEAANRAASGYSDLELDLSTGRRGSRQAFVSNLLSQVTGAEAALVVNNNASAIMLGLAALAVGKEVIVSRGEAVEIGGGFRIPDVLRQSGAALVEVGSTNRTYARDFADAITDNTGALLSVHSSNFRVIGFTHAPELAELVEVGRERNVPVLHDLGSGCMLDTSAYGLMHEPMPQESVSAGTGLSFFSGDKLLGGPQAGIIVGSNELIGIVSRHPLARAVRIDKMSMAALTATLLHYIKQEATEKVPVWRMISMSIDDIQAISIRWSDQIGDIASVIDTESTIGGGSLPGETLPTRAVSIDATSQPGGAQAIAKRLREASTAVIGRIEEERVILDPRTVLPEEEAALLESVRSALV